MGKLLRLGKIFGMSIRHLLDIKRDAKSQRLSKMTQAEHLSQWGKRMLSLLNVQVEVVGEPVRDRSLLYLGNHISYIDIPLLMGYAPVVFVAKKQIGKWPIFGEACRTIGVVMVDRDSKSSREATTDSVAEAIQKGKQSVAIFPSGTTSIDEKKEWRWGAFRMAQKEAIPVQPFRISYSPLRTAAYIDDDSFMSHLWRLLRETRVKVKLEFHPPVTITDPQADCEKWYQWSREPIAALV